MGENRKGCVQNTKSAHTLLGLGWPFKTLSIIQNFKHTASKKNGVRSPHVWDHCRQPISPLMRAGWKEAPHPPGVPAPHPGFPAASDYAAFSICEKQHRQLPNSCWVGQEVWTKNEKTPRVCFLKAIHQTWKELFCMNFWCGSQRRENHSPSREEAVWPHLQLFSYGVGFSHPIKCNPL